MKEILMKQIRNNALSVVGVILSIITLLVYFFFFNTIDRGVSVDEGYYLQGYVQQTTQSGVSDFHNIIKSIFSFLDFENALSLRYFYVGFSMFVFAVFSVLSYMYLRSKDLQINRWIYFSLISATWVLSYCFSSPVLYYDTLQLIIYLLVFSLLFLIELKPKYFLVFISFIGFLLLFSLTNYLPSGILLIAICALWLLINGLNSIKHVVALLIGFIISVVFYSILVQSINDFITQATNSFLYAQSGVTGHSSGNLLSKLSVFSAKSIGVLILSFGVFKILQIARNFIKDRFLYTVLWLAVLGVVISSSFVWRNILSAMLLLIPFGMLLVYIFPFKKIFENKSFIKGFLLFLILICVPIFGVFGTNQALEQKIYFFLVFWALAFLFLYFSYKDKLSEYSKITLPLLFFIQVSFLFLTNGYFKRVHNYYGNKSSNIELQNTPRLKGIKISQHQKNYIENLQQILQENGFKPGDEILGFEVDLLATYAVGGVVFPNNIFYAHYNMTSSRRNIPSNKVKYILLYHRAINNFTEFMKNSNWDFPNSYQRFELGKFTENMNEGQATSLYIYSN